MSETYEDIKRRHAAGSDGSVKLKRGTAYQMRKVSWLWLGWLARGKLHILGGQKGTGKSSIAFDLLAQITSGGKWPDGTPAPFGDVLIWSGEDDIEDTILPRFAVAGGDLNRVYFIEGVIIEGMKRAFDPAIDMEALLVAAKDLPELTAIVIDPIVSATAGDSHKNSETRRGLQPLVDLAVDRDLSVIGITHFTKGTQGTDPIERITGSLAFGAIPRVVWGAAKGDNEDGPRKLVRIASNIGMSGGGFEYLLRQDLLPDHDFTGQRVVWSKRLDGSPLELLENPQDKSKKMQAMALLDELLVNGPVRVEDIRDAAKANSISWPTIERAKSEAGNIIAEQAGRLRRDGLIADEGGPSRGWYWRKQPVSGYARHH
jgi:putative DNA primase/helicase